MNDNDHTHQSALITGASSGLGFETAAQLADAGANRVVVTARNGQKADRAVAELESRTGKNVFEPLGLDLNDLGSATAAVHALAKQGGSFELVVLNAGIPASDGSLTSDGIEKIVAATLTGHHVLTMELLEADLLSSGARIIISGSEAARGDVPTMNPVDIAQLAADSFDGDLESAIAAVIGMAPPVKANGNDMYATTKVFAVWWAAELAARIPKGMTVNAVSPGNTPGTNIATKLPVLVRRVMLPIMKRIPGMAHSVADGASRYLEAAKFGDDVTGAFFASKPKKMTGPLHRTTMTHLQDPPAQRALGRVVETITGHPFPTPGGPSKITS